MTPRKIFIALNALLMAVASAVLIPAFALADVPSSYTSYAYASGVHSIAGTSAFPNFSNGAIDNHYPLAQAQQDSSPSSEGIATYADSGPLAATSGSQYNQSCSNSNPNQPPPSQVCQNPNNSVPYATATSPGGPPHAHIDSCNNAGDSCAGARADADASQLSADSSAFYAGGGAQPFTGATGNTQTIVTSGGTLTVTTHSEVDSFGFGNVKVSKLVVDVTATGTQSSASGDAHVTGGQVTVNGQPVAVNDQGVTVQDKQVVPCTAAPKPPPGPSLPSPPPPPSLLPTGLPGTSGSSSGSTSSSSTKAGSSSSGGCVPTVDVTYIKLWTVAPTKTVDGTHVTIWATGLHILITHPTPGPGVPQQTTEYVLGEGYADLNAGASAGLGFGGFGGGGFGGGGFGGFGGGFDQNGAGAGASNPGSFGSNVTTALAANRVPLAFMFLTLEALLLASAAAWVWSRSTPAEKVPEEVLSP
jgi:hypothetical protein